MNEALKMALFAVAAALIAFTLRAANRQMGAVAALAGGLMLLFFAASRLGQAIGALRTLSQQAEVEEDTLSLLLKMVGMAYLTEFSVQACRDAGEEGLASKAALCGKMLLMAEALPLMLEIGELTLQLVP